ncbi:MAG: hypothetical protein QW303_04725, partial [Nitrososphaerota archaeon]
NKLNIVDSLLTLLESVTDVSLIRKTFEAIKCKYFHYGIILVLESYENFCSHNSEKKDQYHTFIISSNILNRLKSCLYSLQQLRIPGKFTEKQIEKLGFRIPDPIINAGITAVIHHFVQLYNEQTIINEINQKNIDECEECGGSMILFPESSEMRCNQCGYVYILHGTLFDDNQFYNQQGTLSKRKRHNPNIHCEKWLNQIQACENKIIDNIKIKKIDKLAVQEYTKGGKLRPMDNLSCEQIRKWLKKLNFTELNNHAALLRKIITGLHGKPVAPPLLTNEERWEILHDFSRAMAIYEEVIKDQELLFQCGKSKIHNKFYYPFCLAKILSYRLKGDPRLKELLRCIHFQSDSTLIKNDKTWKKICEHPDMDNYIYEPTDPALLFY